MTSKKLEYINRKTRILNLRAKGLTYREIGEECAVSEAYVGNILRKRRDEVNGNKKTTN